jgi:hypothetical protein
MRNEVIWGVRDAQGLTTYEKVFLYTVESRGTMKATWKRAADDMAMSKDTFYRTRSSLIEKNLILTQRMGSGVTAYTVNLDSLTENSWLEDSLTENELSLTENEDSLRAEQKKNIKKNKKKNVQTKKNISANAPVDIPLKEESLEASFDEIVSPLRQDAAFALKNNSDQDSLTEKVEVETKSRWAKEAEIAHARQQKVFEDLGIDVDAEW